MRLMRRIGLLGLMGAASVALSGCVTFGSDSDDAATPPPSPAGSSSAPAAAGAGNGQAPVGNAQVTAPGTKLRLGQRAVVPHRSGGTIGITVTAIEQGDQAAFQQRFGSRAQGMTPYYIRYTVQNVGGTDLSSSIAPTLRGVGQGGGSTGAVVVGTMPGCERGRPDASFATAGATYQGCRLQAASGGRTVAGAEYEESVGGYRDNPIVWTG